MLFHAIKLVVLTAALPDARDELCRIWEGLKPEVYAEPDNTRIMIAGPRGPYYIEKKYLKADDPRLIAWEEQQAKRRARGLA